MDKASQLLLTVFGGIILLAIISVIISRKSQAPQAIQALSNGLANVVKAAVSPVGTAATNGNNGQNAQTYNDPVTFFNDTLSALSGMGTAVGLPGFTVH